MLIKLCRRITLAYSAELDVTKAVYRVRSMDFISDGLSYGRKIRTFNVFDDYNREALGIEVDYPLPAAGVIRSLEQVIEWRG